MSVSFQLGSLTYFQITQKLIYKYIYSVVNQWICKYSFFFLLFRATPMTYGGSQAVDPQPQQHQIRAPL